MNSHNNMRTGKYVYTIDPVTDDSFSKDIGSLNSSDRNFYFRFYIYVYIKSLNKSWYNELFNPGYDFDEPGFSKGNGFQTNVYHLGFERFNENSEFFWFWNRVKEQVILHSFYGMQQRMLEWDMQLVLMEKFI